MSDLLSRLKPAPGARHRRRRVGRGPGSKWGKTAGKGQKGQKSRSGKDLGRGFEGGQMPLQRRLPKRGFINIFAIQTYTVSVGRIERHFESGEVTVADLKAKGLVPKKAKRVKVLGDGEMTKAYNVKVHAFSASARDKIEKAGGKAVVIETAGKDAEG